MSFTNLDHLNVHTKKHAMSLQLSLGNKAAVFVGNGIHLHYLVRLK